MNSLLAHILDFVFPPSREALELHALSSTDLFTKLPTAEPLPFSFITSLFAYKHPLVSELIRSIKNRKGRHAFKLGGYALHEKLQGIPGHIVLIPIPLSKKRMRERGYNQCELLIEEILKLDMEKRFEKNFNLLKRTKHTDEQKLKTRKERFLSSESIFSAEESLLSRDTQLILIDDVSTTGSTLEKAREELMKAGYVNVSAFTLAH